jgi:hypothetical protein
MDPGTGLPGPKRQSTFLSQFINNSMLSLPSPSIVPQLPQRVRRGFLLFIVGTLRRTGDDRFAGDGLVCVAGQSSCYRLVGNAKLHSRPAEGRPPESKDKLFAGRFTCYSSGQAESSDQLAVSAAEHASPAIASQYRVFRYAPTGSSIRRRKKSARKASCLTLPPGETSGHQRVASCFSAHRL